MTTGIKEAIKHAITLLSMDDGDEETYAKKAKDMLFQGLMEDNTAKDLLVKMALMAFVDMTITLQQTEFKEKLDSWKTLSRDEQQSAVSDFTKSMDRDKMMEFLNFIWFGTIVTSAMLAEKLSKKDLLNLVKHRQTDELSEQIDAVMKALDKGIGICEICGDLKHVKSLGPKGQDVCHKCFNKDQSGATAAFNKKMIEMYGPDAVQAASLRAVPATLNDQEMEEYIKKTIIEGQGEAQDISKFN